MTIKFDIPANIEEVLRREGGDPNAAAREALSVDLYRRGILSHGQLATSLGIARTSVDALLKRHGVVEDLMTVDELNAELASLRRLAG